MSSTILGGDFTIFYAAENNQKRVVWTGSSTGTRTMNELYSELQKLFDDPSQMDDLVPIRADTPDIYRFINQWFIDDTTVEHLTGGSLFSDKWIDGTTEHILVIGYAQTTEFNDADIGRTILGATTTDTGTILDFNTDRNLIFIRPVDPLSTGDEFDNGTESYSIGAAANGDAVAQAEQEDASPAGFVDQTASSNSVGDGDIICFPATSAANDAFYLGFSLKFSKIICDRLGGVQGVGGVTAYEYSQGGGVWGTLAGVSDATATGGGFGNAVLADTDAITFTVPTDWVTDSVDSGAQLYWVRFRVTTIYSTEPTMSQIFMSGVGAGAFADHNRHGAASRGGESAWVGITTIGTVETDTHNYISQEDPDLINEENLVVATKGTADWWNDGQLDILVKVKEADSVFGPLPNSSPVTAVATVFARQYSKTYSHFIATGLATAGGNTVVPLSTGDDLDNTTGTRNLVWDNGDTGTTLVDEELLYVVGAVGAGNMDAVVQDNGGVFSDDTTDANSTATGDVNVYEDPAAASDALYFGKDNIFRLLMIDVGTVHNGTTSTQVWEYFDGTTWQTLTVTDDTDGGNGAFDTLGRGLITFTPPSDWARTNITNQPATAPTNLYYVRIRLSVVGNLTTEPILDTCWVGGELQLKARVADTAIITPAGATGNADYYLIGDPVADLVDNDVVVALTTSAGSRKNFDVAGGPTNVGPSSDTDITFAHGQFTRDINENGTADPYSIDLSNASSKTMALAYERAKYLARRAETATASTDGQEGRFYIGSELQIEYTGQAGGNFAEGRRVYDQTTDAVGVIVADHDDGATGDLIVRSVRGTFGTNVVSDSPDPTQVMDTDSFVFQVDASPLGVVDESADALSAGVGDVLPFPATEATGDYFIMAAKKPFARITLDNTGGIQGVGGVGAWEYWDGAAWVDLETAPGFSDGTSDFTNAVGAVNVDFYPPVDWQTRGISDGTVQSSQALYMVRFRVTTVYSTNPTYDTIGIQDFVTATIASVRTVAPITSAPFGTFPGASKFFMAPGLAPTPAEMAAGEAQAYSTIDDNGVTRNPPNKQTVELTNLISGDTVSIMRRTALVINKTQFTLAAGNNKGDTTVVVDASIPSDNPSIASTKIRIISSSGEEHRYRYASFSSATFTLDAAKTGTADGGNSSNTRLHDTTGTFTTAPAIEVGDYVRNITQDEFVRVTVVVSATELDTEQLSGVSEWDGDSYNINTLVENYGLDSAFVPLIERVADATSETTTITYSTDIDIRADVRRTAATSILPFTQDSSVISTGRSIAAIRTTDTIIT